MYNCVSYLGQLTQRDHIVRHSCHLYTTYIVSATPPEHSVNFNESLRNCFTLIGHVHLFFFFFSYNLICNQFCLFFTLSLCWEVTHAVCRQTSFVFKKHDAFRNAIFSIDMIHVVQQVVSKFLSGLYMYSKHIRLLKVNRKKML